MRYGDGSRMPNPYYVRSPEDMYRLFTDHEDAVQRSQEIADGVDIDIDFKKRHFPVFTPPAKKKPEDYLRELCEAGLIEHITLFRGDMRLRGDLGRVACNDGDIVSAPDQLCQDA
jgi:DNA polymerase III alpha subunit